jgi:hypothetical protein
VADVTDDDHAHDHTHPAALAPDDPRLEQVRKRLEDAKSAVRPSGLAAPHASGTVLPGSIPGHVDVVVSRRLPIPRPHAWYGLTTSDGLAAWFGTIDSGPSGGTATVTMLAEDGHPPVDLQILACEAPGLLIVRMGDWTMEVRLDVDGEGCFVAIRHVDVDPAMVGEVGPGWEYYADRWLAASTGGDPTAVDFAEYHPAMAEHFTRQL